MTAVALRSKLRGREFESMYRRHAKDVYRYALAMLDRPADAEDATQTTFLNAYRALERGERPRDAAKWLRAIALNVCREHYRRASRRPDEVSLHDDPGELVLDPSTPAIGDVIRGLASLPFNQRAALVMREFDGRSLAEIATALEVSSSAVEALLFRGRRALREQLEGSLSCAQAEHAISRQLDGALPRAERGQLRAHLRECLECASLARRLRAQRSAIRSLALVPIPASLRLSKLLTGGAAGASAPAGASTGGSLLTSLVSSTVVKVSVAAIAGAAAVGAGYSALHHRSPVVAAPRAAITASRGGSAAALSRPAARGPAAVGSVRVTTRAASPAGSGSMPGRRSRVRTERHRTGSASPASRRRHRPPARGHRASNGQPMTVTGTSPVHGHGSSASSAVAHPSPVSHATGPTPSKPAPKAAAPGQVAKATSTSHGNGNGKGQTGQPANGNGSSAQPGNASANGGQSGNSGQSAKGHGG